MLLYTDKEKAQIELDKSTFLVWKIAYIFIEYFQHQPF